jgi:very-short-patch-repair endonuclease
MWQLSNMGDYRIIDTYAARQYGCFNIHQLRAAGIDRSAVGRRIKNEEWVRLAPGVYAVASASPTWERQQSAAILGHPRAIVGGAAAARLHGIQGFERAHPVILVPRTGNARSPIARVIRTVFFSSLETKRVRGFVVTSPSETILTLAAQLPPRRFNALVDECLLTGRSTLADFMRILDRIEGARVSGAARLRSAILDRHAEEYSVDATYLERLLEDLLSDSRLPRSIREHPMAIRDRDSRVDAFIPHWDVIVEADGRIWHARVSDFENDRARDNDLAAMGFQVIRFTYSMLKNDPERCIQTLLAVGSNRRATRDGIRNAMHDGLK